MFNLKGQGWTKRIGSLLGIPLFFHYSTFLIPLMLMITGNLNFLFIYFIAYICILAHELGHAFMAKRLGYIPTHITILPIGCVVSLSKRKGQVVSKLHEFLIALAGPLVTLGTIIIFYFLKDIHIFKVLYNFSLLIFFFNIIPMFPLDGSRMMRSLLELKLSWYKATKITVITSYVLLGIFTIYSIFNFLIFNFIIIAFLFFYAKKELDNANKNYSISDGFLKKSKLNTTDNRLKHIRGE